MLKKTRGRPRRFAEYEDLISGLPESAMKRPRYVNGIGVFRGSRGDTAWLKIRLPNGGIYKGKHQPHGTALEIKLGSLASWSWEELEAKHRELQRKADHGEPLEEAPAVLFSDWAQSWLDNARTRLRSYPIVKVHVERHLVPWFGTMPLGSITAQDINRWSSERLGQVKPATVKRELATLGSILGEALRAGHLTGNPSADASPIRGVVGRQRFLDGDELVRLLAAAGDVEDWLADFVLWSVHSGMRKSEVRSLAWSDVRDLGNGEHVVMVERSKTDRARTIHCTRTMIEILERQKERRLEGDARVFPVSAMTLRRRWEKARRQAGLEDVTVHDLRRTHSTHAAVAGVDLRTLAGRLGHTDLEMLQRHYAAFVGSAASEAATKIGNTFERMTGRGDD